MAKQPYIAFFTGDWKRDAQVNMCSPETRGIWFDFLCDMHDLQSGGKLTGDKDQLCRAGRCSYAQFDRAISELSTTRTADIHERDGIFTIVCRRLKKVADLAATRGKSGSKSYSKRIANSEDEIESEIESCKWWKDEDFQKCWAQWFEHRIAIRKPLTPIAKLKQIQWLKGIGKDRSIAAINHSIRQQWQGIFEPREQNANGKHYTERPNPRNEGNVIGPTIYGAHIKPRAQREREAAQAGQVATPMAPDGNDAPPD